MSILIPGMKMPTRCWDCPMCYDSIGCILTGEQWWSDSHVYLDFSPNKERMWNCPLIELPPHGRLIDADALKIYQMEENVRADGDPNEYEYDAGLIDGLHMAAKDVSVAPTIIPAEGGDAT